MKDEHDTLDALAANCWQGVALEQRQRVVADEMIEAMRKLKARALQRERAYRRMAKAAKARDKEGVKRAAAELADVPKLRIK